MSLSPRPPDWVRYYPGNALIRLLSVPCSIELAHRRLADYHWSTGKWVAARGGEGPSVSRVHARHWPRALRKLLLLGWIQHRCLVINGEVARTRTEALHALRQRHSAAKRAAQTRWAQPQDDASRNAPRTAVGNAERRAIGCRPTSPINSKEKDIEKEIDNTLNAEHLMLSVSPRVKESPAERDFLRDVNAMYEAWKAGSSRVELANWGGWWRNRYREAPVKARKVLADIRSMVTERAVRLGPGQASMDLWARLP
jgi:hypothetical protein